MSNGTGDEVMITLDSASHTHCVPTGFAPFCPRGADHGPTMRDAQKRPIPFEAACAVPMCPVSGEGKNLMKVNMRLGSTISKPLFSLCRMMDAGVHFWLSSEGSYMQLGDGWAPIERVNDSLAMRMRTFGATSAVRVGVQHLN